MSSSLAHKRKQIFSPIQDLQKPSHQFVTVINI